MKIIISEEAAEWYKNELDLSGRAYVRFHVRYGGVGGNVPGFSLGISVESPKDIHSETTVNDVTFFVEEEDTWYFEDKNLVITLDKTLNEPQFTYEAA